MICITVFRTNRISFTFFSACVILNRRHVVLSDSLSLASIDSIMQMSYRPILRQSYAE